MKLILPVAGSSTRYKGTRPKWMLTLPNGILLIENSIAGFNLSSVNEIIIIALRKHIEENDFSEEYLINSFKNKFSIKTSIYLLDNPTISQPMTVAKYLLSINDDFPFYIKDCDNSFNDEPQPKNEVAYTSLEDFEIVSAKNKSYIKINHFDEVVQIQEKEVISDTFCVGGYTFDSSKSFLKTFDELDGNKNNDLYISHLIHKQILEGKRFFSKKVKNYIDYGTSNEFFLETRKTMTIFSDFDGVLVKNSSKFSNKPWKYEALHKNIDSLKLHLSKSISSCLIITTSRPKSEKNNIIQFCKSHNLDVKEVITDLPHCKRYLVNDFSNSNPFPSAVAINLPRNSETIESYIS